MQPSQHPNKNRPLRLAFGNLCDRNWIAGCHYLKNLFVALRTLEQPPEIVLIYWTPPADETYQILAPYVDEQLTFTSVSRPLPIRAASYLARRFDIPTKIDVPMAAFLRQNRVDALLMMNDMGTGFNFPLMVWVADFQHVHLPEMFTPQEIQLRNANLLTVAERATRIILSSQSAKRDFEQFVPQFLDKARVLSFVSQPPEKVYEGDSAWVCEQYHLPERFFYLPNQFWKHKNHKVVIEALAHLRRRLPQITVVCTGNTHDYRTPGYFPELLTTISKAGVRENFVILGMVPHEHIFPLMRQSLAILQPSFFEGWSTTVEETKSIGKRMILSDIDVHREQNPPNALYFDPNDSQSLAEKLIQVYEEAQPGPDLLMEAAARADLPRRTRDFGQTFVDIVRDLV